MTRAGAILTVAAWFLCSHIAWAASEVDPARDLADLSLEQLGNIVVSSVSGREEPLSRALGSVYVISGYDKRPGGPYGWRRNMG